MEYLNGIGFCKVYEMDDTKINLTFEAEKVYAWSDLGICEYDEDEGDPSYFLRGAINRDWLTEAEVNDLLESLSDTLFGDLGDLSETKYADLARSIVDEGNYESAVELMDDDIREEIHDRYAPCDEVTFLALYMDAHHQLYGEDFAI